MLNHMSSIVHMYRYSAVSFLRSAVELRVRARIIKVSLIRSGRDLSEALGAEYPDFVVFVFSRDLTGIENPLRLIVMN